VRCRIKVHIESASCFSYVKEEKKWKKNAEVYINVVFHTRIKNKMHKEREQ
jgi:hypothetical protein